jgi:hypothetical protein
LNNTGELLVTGYTTTASGGTANITIPTTAKSGKTRMRIQMHYGSQISNPCTTFDYGEVEDYTINISGGTFSGFAVNNATANTLNSIMVSPNPVKGSTANVALQVDKAAPVIIRITDLSGRILRTENVSNIIAGMNNIPLNNLNLFPGTYMIIAEQGNSVVARTQFIVAK